jgi:molybdenum cofactor biosynthesis enzyme
MKFNEYIQINEAAMLVSRSMEKYADIVLDKLFELVEEHVTFTYFKKECHKLIIHSAKVSNEYNEKKVDAVIFVEDKATRGAFMDDNKAIFITIDKFIYDGLKKSDKTIIDHLKKSIKHELTHVLDPKTTKPGLKEKTLEKSNKIQREKNTLIKQYHEESDPKKKIELIRKIEAKMKEYYNQPIELEAYISTEADEAYNILRKKSKTKKNATDYLKNFTPQNELQKHWHNDPKIWKRFILTINKLIERDF